MLPRNQPMVALAKGNAIRLRRAQVKQGIKEGRLEVADVIRAVPPELETMLVFDLLRAQRGWQKIKAREFLARFQIGEGRQLGRLTERQREQLAWALHERRNGR